MERSHDNLRYWRGGSWERGGFILSRCLSSFPSPSLPSITFYMCIYMMGGGRLTCIGDLGTRGLGDWGTVPLFVNLSLSLPVHPSPPFLLLSLEMCTVRQYRAGRYDGRENI